MKRVTAMCLREKVKQTKEVSQFYHPEWLHFSRKMLGNIKSPYENTTG